MKTKCCGYEFDESNEPGLPGGCPIQWNELNLTVQCHNCGIVYVPDGLEPLIVAMERVTREEPTAVAAKTSR